MPWRDQELDHRDRPRRRQLPVRAERRVADRLPVGVAVDPQDPVEPRAGSAPRPPPACGRAGAAAPGPRGRGWPSRRRTAARTGTRTGRRRCAGRGGRPAPRAAGRRTPSGTAPAPRPCAASACGQLLVEAVDRVLLRVDPGFGRGQQPVELRPPRARRPSASRAQPRPPRRLGPASAVAAASCASRRAVPRARPAARRRPSASARSRSAVARTALPAASLAAARPRARSQPRARRGRLELRAMRPRVGRLPSSPTAGRPASPGWPAPRARSPDLALQPRRGRGSGPRAWSDSAAVSPRSDSFVLPVPAISPVAWSTCCSRNRSAWSRSAAAAPSRSSRSCMRAIVACTSSNERRGRLGSRRILGAAAPARRRNRSASAAMRVASGSCRSGCFAEARARP